MRRRRSAGASAMGVAVLLAAAACGGERDRGSGVALQAVPGGDPDRGLAAARARGCMSCHVIPGIRGHPSQVGPPLAGIGARAYIAGELPNEPQNLVAWIRDPQRFRPGSAMPRLGIGEAEARDIAAYLYTLR